MKKHLSWQHLLLLIVPFCVSCVKDFVEYDEETLDNHNKLQGVWEPMYISEWGWFQYPDSPIQHYSSAYPITKDMVEEYWVISFAEHTHSLIAVNDPELVDILGIPAPYTLKGNTLSSYIFSGDYVPYTLIEFSGDNIMRVNLTDVGQGATLDGDYFEEFEYYHGSTVFRRIADADGKTINAKYTIADVLKYWVDLLVPEDDPKDNLEDDPEDDENEIVTVVFPGQWESIKYQEVHYETRSKDGYVEIVHNSYIPEYDLTTEDDIYHVVRLYQGYATIKSAGEKYEKELNDPYPYELEDGKLKCKLFEGEYTDHVTVEYTEDGLMKLTLTDAGSYTDDEGYTHTQMRQTTTTYRIIRPL